jgi:hypothetical protein
MSGPQRLTTKTEHQDATASSLGPSWVSEYPSPGRSPPARGLPVAGVRARPVRSGGTWPCVARQPLAGLLDRQHRLASADVPRRAHGTRPRPFVTNLWPEETTTDHAQTAICQTALDGAGRGRSSREIAISRECSFQRTIHQFPYGASISGAALSRDDWYRR